MLFGKPISLRLKGVKILDYTGMERLPIDIRLNNIECHLTHSHQNLLEILFVLKGRIDVKMSFEDFLMGEGDFLVINCGDYHSVRKREDNIVASIYIDLEHYKRYFKHIDNTIFICDSLSGDDFDSSYENQKNIIRNLLSKIIIELGHKKEGYHEKTDRLMIKLVSTLVNYFSRVNYYNRGSKISDHKLDKYYLMMQYINEKYDEQSLLGDISEKEYFSKSYLSHLFKDVSAWSFQDMLSFTRIWKSEELLLNSDLSVTEISFKAGFSDPKYYYKNFKKYYNCTPLEYRKRFKKDIESGNILREVELTAVLETMEEYLHIQISEDEIEYDFNQFNWDKQLKDFDALMKTNTDFIIGIRYKSRSAEEWKMMIEYCIDAYGIEKIANYKFGMIFNDPDIQQEVNELIKEIESSVHVKIKPIYIM